MTFWQRQVTLAKLALPILFGTMAVTLLNFIDTAMVAQLGSTALAATGLGAFAAMMLTVALNGLGTGVQALTARRSGEGNLKEECVPLNGGLLLALAVGFPMAVACFFLIPHVFPLLTNDVAVIKDGVPYLQALLAPLGFFGGNAAFRGYWNGVGKNTVYMMVLVVSVILNIFGNWVLIYGNLGAPALGTTGAGLASCFTTVVATLIYLSLVLCKAPNRGFLRRRPKREQMSSLIGQALPAGIRGLGTSGGYLVFFWMTGLVGTATLAATNVLFRFYALILLPASALGTAGATLVGQNLGRGDPMAAKRWGWTTCATGFVVMSLVCLPMVFAPHFLLSLFVVNPQEMVPPLQLLGLTAGFTCLEPVLRFALFGAGDSKRVMKLTLLVQWLVFLPAVWMVISVNGGLLSIWTVLILSGILSAALYAWHWQNSPWAKIKI